MLFARLVLVYCLCFLCTISITWGLVLRLGYTRLVIEVFGALLCLYAAVLVAGILYYFVVYVSVITTSVLVFQKMKVRYTLQ